LKIKTPALKISAWWHCAGVFKSWRLKFNKRVGVGGLNMLNEDIQIIVTLSRRQPSTTKKTVWNHLAGFPSMITIIGMLAPW